MALARQFESLALGSVEITEQAADQSVAGVQPQHLAHQQFATGPKGECDVLSALQRERSSRQSSLSGKWKLKDPAPARQYSRVGTGQQHRSP